MNFLLRRQKTKANKCFKFEILISTKSCLFQNNLQNKYYYLRRKNLVFDCTEASIPLPNKKF